MSTRSLARRVSALALSSLAGCAAAQASPPPPQHTPAATAVPKPVDRTSRAATVHLLNRFTFGATPETVARVEKLGSTGWLALQLQPASVPDASQKRLAGLYPGALRTPQSLSDEADEEDMDRRETRRHLARVGRDVQMLQLARQIESTRQVQEVMVDFWVNHFNVFARKGPVRLYVGDYLEQAIRPNALKRFEDLLLATARHPAMLAYLDNAKSVAPPEGSRAAERGRGLNENYARELLELHTLGVNGGYQQKDVVEVARVLTGWSLYRPRSGETGFHFRARFHDDGKKVVLGQEFPGGGGEEEGVALLKMLAAHPSTARHLSTKLCQRFVSDQPGARCVKQLSKTYTRTGGDISQMLVALLSLDEFWRAQKAKVKTPSETVVSALRALDARADGSLGLIRVLARLGQPVLLESAPTGYSESSEDWVNAGAMLGRMNLGVSLAAGRVPGVTVDTARVLPTSSDSAKVIAQVNQRFLGGTASPKLLAVLDEELADVKKDDQKRAFAIALVVGSPEFQRQ